ncbi:3-oxoacyl-[acyl-carrier-protein] synthase, KASIII [Alloactinosynnema sp. L-07]|uniref:beta-ketoacyl-ACP synthase III n=1 Tax=Alloactinosynnema sp. L-07 TaxID=1653480 RepID=UPI00065F06E2|nr:beta-ketoacyl-ACP synthase III [Alloactinosynnema sp. L-07]CRK58244.1 3-oxoacyl-[acyl-carrier-protein] synthase, KASIII [Alloactinosynnema sp. L-07]
MRAGNHGAAAVLAGLGGWLPPRVVGNAEIAPRLGTSAEWIQTRTGISGRHWIDQGMSTVGLATEAGARALKSAGLTEVGAVVLATTTPDRPCPASAPEVAARLGLPCVAAFDIGAVCAGFVYALAAGAGLISAGVAGDVLVIGADAFSTILDPTDRGTAMIFGDGAGAVVLRAGEPDEPGALGPFDLGSDGDHADLVMIPAGGSRQRLADDPRDLFFTMQGKATFKHAVQRMSSSARAVLAEAGWRTEDVDWVIGHQANQRIIDALGAALDVPAERLVSNIDRVGNTAAASIPLAMSDAAPRIRPGDRVLLTSFGGGLAWGSTALRWPAITAV